MKMIILNGSPKANSKSSNTEIFIHHFTSAMKMKYEVKYIATEEPKELAQYIKTFDTILIVMPLYIHAMPSGVMKLIEHLESSCSNNQSIGFIVQAGFPESAHEKFVREYFEELAKRLHYQYLGTVVKGGSAFIYRRPKHFKKLYKSLADLGRIFEKTHAFDKKITQKLAKPYQFNKFALWQLRLIDKIGLVNYEWNAILRQNNALEHALNQPFLEEVKK